MAIFQFEDADGNGGEFEVDPNEIVSFGETMEIDGKLWTRCLTMPSFSVEKSMIGGSMQLAPHTPGFDHYDDEGRPCPRNRHEQREGAKRAGLDVLD